MSLPWIYLCLQLIKNNQVKELSYSLKFNESNLEATILDYCDRDDIQLNLNELLVIEYYSRR